jgi:hypothetical protein
LIIIGCYKTSIVRRNSELILPVRITIKILAPIIGVLAILILKNLPFSVPFPFLLLLILIDISSILIFLCSDIIVTNDGIYMSLMLKSLSWDRIKEITNHPSYLAITGHRKRDTKQYIKFIWNIRDEDVAALQSLFFKKMS